MPILFALAALVLGAWVAVQFYWIWRFSSLIRARGRVFASDAEFPKVAVVLSLRGADPFLDRCINGLMCQNYPNYEVRIVVDNELDPAWELVQRCVGGKKNVRIEPLKTRLPTCGLRISALLQAVMNLDASYGAVVVVDADVVAHANWLRDLVGPMTDPTVGATTGIRWFMPEASNLGTLIRYLWNAGAIPQMHAFGIGWGGSLAIRTELLLDGQLIDKWSKILFEDTFTANEIRRLGHKLEFVPAATMVNSEFIDLRSALRFISRQMLNVRLYHDSWVAILAIGVFSAIALAIVLGQGIYGTLAGAWPLAAQAAGAFAVYCSGTFLALARWESWFRTIARSRGETVPSLSWNVLWAVPVTQLAFLVCLLTALCTRKVEWRGVTYRLHGPSRIRLVEYQPYQPGNQEARVPMSL